VFKLKLVLCEELVCCWQSVSILLKIANDIVKNFTIMLVGIPFAVIGDRGNDRVLDCLVKVGVLHCLGFGLLNIGFASADDTWCSASHNIVCLQVYSTTFWDKCTGKSAKKVKKKSLLPYLIQMLHNLAILRRARKEDSPEEEIVNSWPKTVRKTYLQKHRQSTNLSGYLSTQDFPLSDRQS